MITDNDSGFKASTILGIILGLIFIAFDFEIIGTLVFILYLWIALNWSYDSHA